MTERWDVWPSARLILVAERDGDVCGFASTELGDVPLLDNLHVSPLLKRQGVGAVLLSATAHALAAQGARVLSLEVLAENAPSRSFYQKMGGEEGAEYSSTLLGYPVRVAPFRWQEEAFTQLAEQFAPLVGKGA
ncbi:MAG: GNAT family N-acetyltransferase [Pseudomonadota bacterium]